MPEHRFVHREGDAEAELIYRVENDRLVLVHTEVPASLGGRGVGGRLVRTAVEYARSNDLAIVPSCSFARKWLEDHGDEIAGVDINW